MGCLRIDTVSKREKENAETWSCFFFIKHFLEHGAAWPSLREEGSSLVFSRRADNWNQWNFYRNSQTSPSPHLPKGFKGVKGKNVLEYLLLISFWQESYISIKTKVSKLLKKLAQSTQNCKSCMEHQLHRPLFFFFFILFNLKVEQSKKAAQRGCPWRLPRPGWVSSHQPYLT